MIHEFDFTIYPRKLWITYDTTIQELTDIFPSGDTRDRPWEEIGPQHDAVVDAVEDKDHVGGYLIRFKNKNSIDFRNVSHESCHVANWICDFIGYTPEMSNDEPYAYLVGFIAKCCEVVLKFKKDGDNSEGGHDNEK